VFRRTIDQWIPVDGIASTCLTRFFGERLYPVIWTVEALG